MNSPSPPAPRAPLEIGGQEAGSLNEGSILKTHRLNYGLIFLLLGSNTLNLGGRLRPYLNDAREMFGFLDPSRPPPLSLSHSRNLSVLSSRFGQPPSLPLRYGDTHPRHLGFGVFRAVPWWFRELIANKSEILNHKTPRRQRV